jgi:hypothetical protein
MEWGDMTTRHVNSAIELHQALVGQVAGFQRQLLINKQACNFATWDLY